MIEHKEWGKVPQVHRPDTAANECSRALRIIRLDDFKLGTSFDSLLRFLSLGLALLLDEILPREPCPECYVRLPLHWQAQFISLSE